MKALFLTSLLLLFGCASKPKFISKNEANDPLFYPKNHATIGTSIGSVWADKAVFYNFFGPPIKEGYKADLYFNPTFSYDVNISKWASYQVWPLYWKFLLTGEQFEDSLHLKVNKVHVVIEGGPNGIAYSARDGLTTSIALAGRLKYLFNKNLFSETILHYSMYNTKEPKYSIVTLFSEIGSQISAHNSISLSYSSAYYNIPRFTGNSVYGIVFEKDESLNEVMLKHSFYLFKKNIFGPEVSFGFKNYALEKDNYFKVGVHYSYVFN
jgi:hypothetical protein